MRLFLQIDIGDWKQRHYNATLVPYASSLAHDLMGTDIDNESESSVIDLVIKLTEQAESVFVFVSARSGVAPGSVDKMMRHLHQCQTKIDQVVLLGEHPAIETCAPVFENRFLKATNIEEVKTLIQNFAKKTPTPGRTSGLAP